MARFDVDLSGVERVHEIFDEYGTSALLVINDVLHEEAGPIIRKSIQTLIPRSGRRWKGKKQAAASANSLRDENENMLEVIVRSKTPYNYLYFPDDGTNTYRHVGNQQFMYKGASNVTDDIIDICTGRLIEKIERR